MMKLTLVTLCLLVVSAMAMPVAEDDRKPAEQQPAPASVVPLEKSRSTAPVLLSGEQPIVSTEARAIEPEKKIEEPTPKKMDDIKKEDLPKKDTEKKPETEMAKKTEEEKKPIEEPKMLEEEKKPELEATKAAVAPTDKPAEQAIVERKSEDLKSEPTLTELPALAPAAAIAEIPKAASTAEVAPEPAQPKNVEEPLAIEKKSSEPAKEIAKPDEMRVTREAEEAAKKSEAEKKPAVELKLAATSAAASEPALMTAEPIIEAATPIKEEDKPKVEAASTAAAAAVAEEPKKVEDLEKKAEAVEAKSVEPLKPILEAAIVKEQRSEDSPAATIAAEVESPVAAAREEIPLVKESAIDSERAIPVEEQKITAAVVEKSAKLADEAKAEELPKPEEVKDDAKPALAAEPIAAEKKEEALPVEEKKDETLMKKKDEKLMEKKDKDDSSEEKDDSSEEKKLDDKKKPEEKKKEDLKKNSSEEKDSSEEEMKLKKDDLKKEAAPITAESQAAEIKAPAS